MEATAHNHPSGKVPLRLLLFIDKRPSMTEQVRHIRQYLKTLEDDFQFHVEVIDVGEHPYLAEHYRLIASPALIKVAPPPQQMLAGSDIVSQLEQWWPRWRREYLQQAEAVFTLPDVDSTSDESTWPTAMDETLHSAQLMKLSDEIFRLNQQREELEAQIRFKDRIIAMMAHDLRNPLTAASIAIETLEFGYSPDHADRQVSLSPQLTGQLLKHAKTQIRAINRMITDILKTARGASVELQLYPQELDLAALCIDLAESMQRRLQDKRQCLTLDLPQDLPTVYADGSKVRRVLVNLLDNAIKYTPRDGQVSIGALHRTTQKVQITIRDTGPGIPQENQDNIFEESYRLQRDQAQDGYGLGLALCQRIVRAHYGEIWVDSTPGEGSAFYFTLPVYRA